MTLRESIKAKIAAQKSAGLNTFDLEKQLADLEWSYPQYLSADIQTLKQQAAMLAPHLS